MGFCELSGEQVQDCLKCIAAIYSRPTDIIG